MDVPTLSLFFRPILAVSTVLNTGETGDMYLHYWFNDKMQLTILGVNVTPDVKENRR